MQTTEPVRKAVQSTDEIGEPSAKQVAAIMPEKSEAEALPRGLRVPARERVKETT